MSPETQTIRSRDQMTERYFETLCQMIRSQAYRELAASQCFAYALRHVPTLAYKRQVLEHVAEELEHYEICVSLWSQIGGPGDLDAICHARLAEGAVPLIDSFLELGAAQFLYDCASAYQLREYENSSFDPYCEVVGKILEEEEGHESFGAEVLIKHCRDESCRPEAQALFDKWLAVSLCSFGRPGSEGSRYAVSVGLKTRDGAAIQQDYVDGLKPTMRLCGLRFPDLEKLGVEITAGLNLSL